MLNADQSKNPLSKFLDRVAARAARMVEAGVVKSTIVKLADMTVPEINTQLIGKKIEYVYRINRTATSRSELYPYVGEIMSVELHTPNPKARARGRAAKAKAKGRGRAKGKAPAKPPASTSVPGTIPSAWVKWLNTGDGDSEESRVILDISFYGAVDKEDGWLITDFDGDENTPMCPIEMTVEEQMHWSAIKAEFLCPKM